MTTTKSPNSAAEDSAGSPRGRRFLHWNRRFAHLARWLHTYLSMVSFAILLFFALTGFTLNHAEWFDAQQRTSHFQGTLERAWLRASDPQAPSDSKTPASKTVAQPEIVAYLRRVHGIRGAAGDFQVDDAQCSVSFKGPGYEADAVIDRESGKYDLTVSRFGLVAILNDLHKGRDTGPSWSKVIDFSALFMAFVALTGLTLIFYLTKRRASGLVAFALGALLCYLIYAVWVP